MSGPLILIGYWRSNAEPHWPDPARMVEPWWPSHIRSRVLAHLRGGINHASYMGFSDCRICGAPNGSTESHDGVYVWPDGLAHYVEAHDVRMPAQFVEHVLSGKGHVAWDGPDPQALRKLRRQYKKMLPNAYLEAMEALLVDSTWWRQQVTR